MDQGKRGAGKCSARPHRLKIEPCGSPEKEGRTASFFCLFSQNVLSTDLSTLVSTLVSTLQNLLTNIVNRFNRFSESVDKSVDTETVDI